MPEDREKKRARDEKYRGSKKGKATKQRWLKTHEDELAKKREEKAMERRVAFWEKALRRDGKAPYMHIHCVKRLWFMCKAGKDIEAIDPWNAKYVFMWENKGRFEKKEEEPTVGSREYY